MTGGAVAEVRRLPTKYWGVFPVAIVIALFAVRACLSTPPLENLGRDSPDAREPRDPPGTVVYEGSLYNARGGPVVLAFQARNDARLVVRIGFEVKELRGRGLV